VISRHRRQAKTVRMIFERYLALGSFQKLIADPWAWDSQSQRLRSRLWRRSETQKIGDRTKAGMAGRPNRGDACPSGQSSRCRTVSVCRTVKACQFAEGDIGGPHWVALSLIDMSEDYQCHNLAHIVVVVHPPRK
jgi:hypothetical protein